MNRVILAAIVAALWLQPSSFVLRAASSAPAANDALRFFKSHFVTGDYAVGGIGLYGTGRGVITIDEPKLADPTVDVLAAYLYWQVVIPDNGSPDVGGTGVTFNGYTLNSDLGPYGKSLGAGTPTCSAAGGGAGSSNGSKKTYSYRADVLRFLNVSPMPPSGTGKTRVHDEPYAITLPTSGGLAPLGASLVVIYRDASMPLSSIVVYDGTYAMDQSTESMSQTIEGFYDADGAVNGSRLTHIVGSGQANKSERLYYNGALVATNPFQAFQGGLWDNYSTAAFTADPALTSVTTGVDHAGFNSFDCLTWAAVVYKTTVKDTDNDGLLNRWETATAAAPVTDPYGRDLPYLGSMGANPAIKDLFIEIGYFDTDNFTADGVANDPGMTYGSVVKPGHSHRPDAETLKTMGDALWNAPQATQRVKVHFDVGASYPGGSLPDCGPANQAGPCIIRGTSARGGEVIAESFTQCNPTSLVPWDCQFSAYPGTVGWKTGYQYMRDQILARPAPAPAPPALDPCDDPFSTSYGACTRRFDPNRINIFHYALFAHSVGLPESEQPCLSGDVNASNLCPGGATDINPAFRTPRTNTGLGDFPGGDSLITMGGFNDLNGLPVGTPFMQASTLAHEFGHNAMRRHGGEAFEPNCRPTYLSVMNYMYQLRGLLDDNGVPHLDFSREVGGPVGGLNEQDLDDLGGVFKRYRIGWYAPLAGSYLDGQPGARVARAHCNGSPKAPTEAFVRIDARRADVTGGGAVNYPIDWDADGNPVTTATAQDVNFSGFPEQPYPDAAATSDWEALDLRQIGSRRSAGGWYIDTDGSLALGPLSILSGKGDAGKGDAGKGDAGKGDAGKGDAGKGDAGKGDAGGLHGKGDAGKGDAGGGDLFDSNDPRLPGGELDARLAADLGVAAPNMFDAQVVIDPDSPDYHRVRMTWLASNEGNALRFLVYRVEGDDVTFDDDAWTLVASKDFERGKTDEYSALDTTKLIDGMKYTYFAVAVYPDLTTPAPNDIITSELSRRATIVAEDDALVADADGPYSVNEDPQSPLSVPAASGVLAGDGDPDDNETLTAVLVTAPSSGTLTLDSDGSFTYMPAPNAFGRVTFEYTARATYPGSSLPVDSPSVTVTIDVLSVNDVPSFVRGANQSVSSSAGAQTVAGWATAISRGPANESGQAVSFLVSVASGAGLFSAAPAVSPTGTLTYTPVPDANGSATVSVRIQDDGGTDRGGIDTSVAQAFTITVLGPATFVGIQNTPPSKAQKSGSAIPMKWQYRRGGIAVDSANVSHTVTISGGGISAGYSCTFPPPGGAATCTDPGSSYFKYDATTKQWSFNLQTKQPDGTAYPSTPPNNVYTVTIASPTPGFVTGPSATFQLTLVR